MPSMLPNVVAGLNLSLGEKVDSNAKSEFSKLP